jgi:hypothetical protein
MTPNLSVTQLSATDEGSAKISLLTSNIEKLKEDIPIGDLAKKFQDVIMIT